ncbi:biogenesis of lysosome-related organelles complex 1 subunit 4 [Toxorhynchites rutilus septentrionalis]|uniref:biogenesis of lysosome-related organelles complex 1 subunit 4 n=1 Tax=Toxorhynchites rutilus septentrionalis TaxID=329112 RepID=UPI00247A1B7D|nr:biogenesis of lysosome-related organelles complex 1 subunit 4 [Toxorhynchites rutilus septentrionalis]
MAEELAEDYSSYFQASNLQSEISPISTRVDEMLLRLEEFENLLEMAKQDTSIATLHNIPKIVSLKPQFDSLCERLDGLEKFVAMVSKNLDVVERQVQVAEEELDIPDKTINVLLKSLSIFGKPKQVEKHSNRDANGVYNSPAIFKTEEYFGPRSKQVGEGSENVKE